jgi:hypothetical protein
MAGMGEGPLLLDAGAPDAPSWMSMDDVVMGGRSSSRMERTPEGDALFHGRVILEGGGFASVRTRVDWSHIPPSRGLLLKVLGDGRQYRLRLWMTPGMNQVAYQSAFVAAAGEWSAVELPFATFTPSFRGRDVPGAPPLEPERIVQVGLMVADRQGGAFRLLLREIRALS